MDWNFSIASVCGAVAAISLFFFASGCEERSTKIMGEAIAKCVHSGGDWISMQDSKRGLCIRRSL